MSNIREYKKLWELLIFDKRFNGVPKEKQMEISSFAHVSAEKLKDLDAGEGDVRLISTGQFNGYTTEELAGAHLNTGEIITIPTGGVANIKYYNGKFVDSGNIIGVARSKDIKLKFVYYYLLFNREQLNSFFRGASIKHPYMPDICEMLVPLYSINEQDNIITQLGLSQCIIEKQKAQLKELDTLAESIFYDMFGDIVTNENGWDVSRLEEDCEVSSAKRVLVEDVVDDGIPFIRGTELTALNKSISSKDVRFTMFITAEHYERLKAITGVPKIGDILIPSINSDGITWIVDTDSPFYFKDGRVIWVHVNFNVYNSWYLKYTISKMLQTNYKTLTSGATFLELKLFIIRDLLIPIPPLQLQQQFAERIEAIEHQKTLIKKSIDETQKLFDYTMDKYFG